MPENDEIEKVVVSIRATDNDMTYNNTKILYAIIDGNVGFAFHIEPTTGDIRISAQLDREVLSAYNLTVVAGDCGFPSLNATTLVAVTIFDMNDNAPQFGNDTYHVDVKEGVPFNTKLVNVTAYDADIGENSRVQYSIVAGNEDDIFDIDRDIGIIAVRLALDYETRTFYELVVVATDCGTPRLSALTTVIIGVMDVNEFKPFFSEYLYLYSVAEHQPAGTYIFTARAADKDGGPYGIIHYRLTSHTPEDVELIHIDTDSGNVTTRVVFMHNFPPDRVNKYQYRIIAEDAGGNSSAIGLVLSVEADILRPRFEHKVYSFQVAGNAPIGHVVGRVQAFDRNGIVSHSIIYFLRQDSDYFAVNRTSGVIFVLHDLRSVIDVRSRRSPQYQSEVRSLRMERDADTDLETWELQIVAKAESTDQYEETRVSITVNRSCDLCAVALLSHSTGLAGTPLVLLIVFLVVAFILILLFTGMYLRGRRRKHPPDRDLHCGDSSSLETIDLHPPPLGNFSPPSYIDAQNYTLPMQNTTSEMSDRSRSPSSGHGSVEKGDDVDDEEIRMINSVVAPEMQRLRAVPDSGLPCDPDGVVDQDDFEKEEDEFMALLNGGHSNAPDVESVKSMHYFSDEGGGEGDGLDMDHAVFSKNDGLDAKSNGAITDPDVDFSVDVFNPMLISDTLDSLSNPITADLVGTYDWDRLLNWGPQYHQLASVFTEFAKLKDECVRPKMRVTQIVPQRPVDGVSIFGTRTRTVPPPIIAAGPPRALPCPPDHQGRSSRSSNTPTSSRTSQLNSVSLPKSPVSYESSFTSLALSHPFTPSISPLGTCSPSVSTLNNSTRIDSPSSLDPRHEFSCSTDDPRLTDTPHPSAGGANGSNFLNPRHLSTLIIDGRMGRHSATEQFRDRLFLHNNYV